MSSLSGTWLLAASRSISTLLFQSYRQRSEATNSSNQAFLYCAFLDFRYCPRGGPGVGEGSRCGARMVPRARSCDPATPLEATRLHGP